MGIVKELIIKYFISFVRLIQQTFNSQTNCIFSREYEIKEKINYNFAQNINLYISRKINLGKYNQENTFDKLFEFMSSKKFVLN